MIKNCNSNEEIHKSIVNHPDLKEAIEESLSTPIDLFKAVFRKLGLKENTFKIFNAATSAEIKKYELKKDQFDANIADLSRREDISKFKKFEDFLNKHTARTTCYFDIYKCSDTECSYHLPLRGEDPVEVFGDPAPHTEEDGKEHYQLGSDPEEKYMPCKLGNLAKRGHAIPFSSSA